MYPIILEAIEPALRGPVVSIVPFSARRAGHGVHLEFVLKRLAVDQPLPIRCTKENLLRCILLCRASRSQLLPLFVQATQQHDPKMNGKISRSVRASHATGEKSWVPNKKTGWARKIGMCRWRLRLWLREDRVEIIAPRGNPMIQIAPVRPQEMYPTAQRGEVRNAGRRAT